MANLTAWKFDSPDGASQAVRTLKELQDEGLIVITSAAIVEWPQGNKKPKTRQIDDMTGREAAGGAFWGFLFGILFFVPLFGAAVGAGIGALHGSLGHVGIDEKFIDQVKSAVTEGTSALFLMSSSGVGDQIQRRFIGTNPVLIATTMGPDQEAKLREVFGQE
ncbi:MAG TPA: DUF1269 domain-containing protein [Propionibacteriaceae bacterium]|jgi:uncharacterized membrane protein|nr:DUF1269 domain-containing protein [Propionibacteriaceae bacterium]